MDANAVNHVVFDLDMNVYRLAAIKKAAYKFGDRCFIQVATLPNGCARVEINPKAPTASATMLEAEFRNEALDQELREMISDETVGVRNLLLAQAFSATSLTAEVGESAEYADDPLDIRRFQHDDP
jgi:His-Xaa-Ser system protein HxsD